jgi:hypothetical protein
MPKKKAAKTKATLDQLFNEWWKKNADKKVARIANSRGGYRLGPWLEPGDDRAWEVVWGLAHNAFRAGHLGEIWNPSEERVVGFGLDKIIEDAYLAGKESVS